jgi:hypothetical protein
MSLLAAISLFSLPGGIDGARLLEAIRQVEGSPVGHVSAADCRGIYQLGRLTWMQHSKKPFLWAISESPEAVRETERVALAHTRWIAEKVLPGLGLPPTPYSVALVWRKGATNVRKLNLTKANVDYAKRVQALYESQ